MSKAQKIVLWDAEVRDTVQRIIAALKLDGRRPWELVIRPFYESPSDRQRGYYRSTILPMLCQHVEDCGYGRYTPEQMHEWLKREFGEKVRVEVMNTTHDVVDFTTSGKGEMATMSAFIDRVLMWAANDLGLYIPPPRVGDGNRTARET